MKELAETNLDLSALPVFHQVRMQEWAVFAALPQVMTQEGGLPHTQNAAPDLRLLSLKTTRITVLSKLPVLVILLQYHKQAETASLAG